MQRIIIYVFVVFFLSTTLFAESLDWQNVGKLRKGKTIYVMLNSGKWLTAKIEKVEDEKLVVESGAGRFEAYRKEEIQEIYIKKASIGKSILLGTAIVAGGALALDVAVEHGYSGEDKYMYAPFIVMYAAPIGAGLGYLHGITSQKKDLIYKSERKIAEDYEIGNISEPHLPETRWLKVE